MSEHVIASEPWEVHLPKKPKDHEQALDAGISASVNGERKIIAEVFGQVGLNTFIPSAGIAARIVADHNGCLGIVDPETTVPELVDACADLIEDYDECISASEFGDGQYAEKLLDRVKAALAKTGKP